MHAYSILIEHLTLSYSNFISTKLFIKHVHAIQIALVVVKDATIQFVSGLLDNVFWTVIMTVAVKLIVCLLSKMNTRNAHVRFVEVI